MWLIEYLLFLVGIKVTFQFLIEVHRVVLTVISNKNLKEYGENSWALVTACTDGIGQGFAETFAKRGFNIIQVGRSPEKLKNTSMDLVAKYGIKVKNIVKDFSHSHLNPTEFFTDIYNQSKGLDVSIIVNNVGFSAELTTYASVKIEKVINLMSLNLLPIVYLTRLYLPDMIKRQSKSAIINLSSVASQFTLPKGIQYSASKAFDDCFTDVLANELSQKVPNKIDVMCLKPGFVDTPLASPIKVKPLLINKYQCAEKCIKCLGSVNDTAGHWKHLIVLEILKFVNYLRLGY